MKHATRAVTAGRRATLEEALATLEGGARTLLGPTGPSAATGALLSYLSTGDHLLMSDSCQGALRRFCDGALRRLGVHTTYFDPQIGAGIAALMRPTTRAVYLESPSRWTFEVPDVPAIADLATARGAWTLVDNSWATPLRFKAFEHGADVSLLTEAWSLLGQDGAAPGAATASRSALPKLERGWAELGLDAGEAEAGRARDGLAGLETRLARHEATGVALAEWLFAQPEILEVLHPALPWDPGHRLWKRDFTGAGGLFGFVLAPGVSSDAHLAALREPLELIGQGEAWGGAGSRLSPVAPQQSRTATPWPRPGRPEGRLMRLYAGLEHVDDLIEDLKAGLERLRSV